MTDYKSKLDLDKIRIMPNIATELSDEQLASIATDVIEGYDEDVASRKEWMEQVDFAMKLAELNSEHKNTPFEDASNIKYPLLTTASIQFAARTYPEIVRNGKVVEINVIGADPDGTKTERARRVSSHMSYQLLVESTEWEENTDSLLHILSIVGTVFKKTFFDPIENCNRSLRCLPSELVINDNIRSLKEAQRISHKIYKTKNQLVELQRAGLYLEYDEGALSIQSYEHNDEFCLIEQHRFLDLDGDGYKEPYIVTVEKDSHKVLRIVARFDGDDKSIIRNRKGKILRIVPVQYFTDFHFIPHPAGKFHSIGFGRLIAPLNSSVNTILNLLVDAGKLANMQCGFISSSVKIKPGDLRLKLGEWKQLRSDNGALSQNIYPLNYKEPSTVLFQLLGMLVTTTEKLSSVTDALTGTQKGQNTPATTMLELVEQGLKVFTAIQRRLMRSFKKEYEKLYRLNRIYLDDNVYFNTVDEQGAVKREDYEDDKMDIKPVSDPSLSSDAQRLARSQAIMGAIGTGVVDPREAVALHFRSIGVPDSLIAKLIPAPQPQQPSEIEKKLQVQAALASSEHDLKEKELALQARELDLKQAKIEAEIQNLKAQALKNIAEAEAAEAGSQLENYKLQLETLKTAIEHANDQVGAETPETESTNDNQAGNSGVGATPDNQTVEAQPPTVPQ